MVLSQYSICLFYSKVNFKLNITYWTFLTFCCVGCILKWRRPSFASEEQHTPFGTGMSVIQLLLITQCTVQNQEFHYQKVATWFFLRNIPTHQFKVLLLHSQLLKQWHRYCAESFCNSAWEKLLWPDVLYFKAENEAWNVTCSIQDLSLWHIREQIILVRQLNGELSK